VVRCGFNPFKRRFNLYGVTLCVCTSSVRDFDQRPAAYTLVNYHVLVQFSGNRDYYVGYFAVVLIDIWCGELADLFGL